jgi:hypothetical protein
MAENYQQHAEHYFRILQSFQPQASDNNEAAAENGNGVAEDSATPIDGGAEANGQGADGAADNDAQGEANDSEPLVLVRGHDGDNEDANNDGKDASKSRRRGPLGRKRKANPSDAVADADMSDCKPATTVAETADAGEGDTAIPVE